MQIFEVQIEENNSLAKEVWKISASSLRAALTKAERKKRRGRRVSEYEDPRRFYYGWTINRVQALGEITT